MKPNAKPEQSLRIEVPLAFCPLFVAENQQCIASSGEVATSQCQFELLKLQWRSVGLCRDDSKLRSIGFSDGGIAWEVLWLGALQFRHAASLPRQTNQPRGLFLTRITA